MRVSPQHNIHCGDALTMKIAGGTPIMFAETDKKLYKKHYRTVNEIFFTESMIRPLDIKESEEI